MLIPLICQYIFHGKWPCTRCLLNRFLAPLTIVITLIRLSNVEPYCFVKCYGIDSQYWTLLYSCHYANPLFNWIDFQYWTLFTSFITPARVDRILLNKLPVPHPQCRPLPLGIMLFKAFYITNLEFLILHICIGYCSTIVLKWHNNYV